MTTPSLGPPGPDLNSTLFASANESAASGTLTSGAFPPLGVAEGWHIFATVAFFGANLIGNTALAIAAWTGLRQSRGATRRLSLVTDFPQMSRRSKEPKATACDHILIAVFVVGLCRCCTRAPIQIVQMLSGRRRHNANMYLQIYDVLSTEQIEDGGSI